MISPKKGVKKVWRKCEESMKRVNKVIERWRVIGEQVVKNGRSKMTKAHQSCVVKSQK